MLHLIDAHRSKDVSVHLRAGYGRQSSCKVQYDTSPGYHNVAVTHTVRSLHPYYVSHCQLSNVASYSSDTKQVWK
jgi:hypothetical protein